MEGSSGGDLGCFNAREDFSAILILSIVLSTFSNVVQVKINTEVSGFVLEKLFFEEVMGKTKKTQFLHSKINFLHQNSSFLTYTARVILIPKKLIR